MKERRRRQAQAMEPGDRIVFYLTPVGRFGGAVRLTSAMFEDREPVLAGQARARPTRTRGASRPSPRSSWTRTSGCRPRTLKDELEHVRKWPAEHWTLAFQGQLRTVSDADADVLLQRLRAAAGVAAP